MFCEHRLNLHHRDNKNNFKQMFQREVACRAVAANNVHQNVGRVQEGGTEMVAFGESTGNMLKTGKDPYGLGRWCWTLYGGSEGHKTRVVVAYNACKNSKKDLQTTYQQQRQYFITKKKDLTCPNKLSNSTLFIRLKSGVKKATGLSYSWTTMSIPMMGHWEGRCWTRRAWGYRRQHYVTQARELAPPGSEEVIQSTDCG